MYSRLAILLLLLLGAYLGVSAQAPAPEGPADIPATPAQQPLIAGIPYAEARAILERHEAELLKLPGVQAVILGTKGIGVYTTNPAALPAGVEGLPINPLGEVYSLKPPLAVPGEPPPQLTPPSTPPPSTPPETSATAKLPLIAGRPYKEALAILKRHEQELMNLPGVDAIDMDEEGILVYTDNPSAVPSTIEGLPVRTTISLAQTFPPVKPEEPHSTPPPLDCGPYAHWESKVGRCRRDALPPDSLISRSPRTPLPPPAGVIILRLGGVREEADICPEGFEEKLQYGWRFCVPPGYADPLPPMWEPPIEGVPYEKAQAILERHKPQLLQLPGVTGVGLSAYGVVVFTDNPAVVPSTAEGLPIITRPSIPATVGSHSRTTLFQTMVGALAIRDQLWIGRGTLTGIALSKGKPWLIFPAHLMRNCHMDSVCPPGTTEALNDCSHYAGIRRIVQPTEQMSRIVGFVQRWDPIAVGGTLPNTDVAAAFMDDNAVEGDGSLPAAKAIEGWGPFSGQAANASLQHPATTMISSVNTSPAGDHTLPLNVVAVNVDRNAILHPGECHDPDNMTTTSVTARFVNQTIYETPVGALCPTFGDSGSPILNEFGQIVSMLNSVPLDSSCLSSGTGAFTIKDRLGFDTWYGTNTSDLSVQLWPTFHSVVAGQGACAFAYIKNTGTVTAQNVAIVNDTFTSPQPSFDYLNPNGQWNVPYNIPPGQTATYSICMTNSVQGPINWILNFYGTTAAAPIIKASYNTFGTTWNSVAVPDPVIGIGFTSSGDDVVHLGGVNGANAEGFNTINVGASGYVTITLDTDSGYGSVPVTLAVCETDNHSNCLATPAPTVSHFSEPNIVHFYSVFLLGQGQAIPLDPYYKRFFFRIRQGQNAPTGPLLGSAGLSVTTNSLELRKV